MAVTHMGRQERKFLDTRGGIDVPQDMSGTQLRNLHLADDVMLGIPLPCKASEFGILAMESQLALQ